MLESTVSVRVLPDGRVTAMDGAKYLGLAVKTLAMMRTNGTGPKYVKRGRIFYYINDLEAWMKDGERLSTAQNGKGCPNRGGKRTRLAR